MLTMTDAEVLENHPALYACWLKSGTLAEAGYPSLDSPVLTFGGIPRRWDELSQGELAWARAEFNQRWRPLAEAIAAVKMVDHVLAGHDPEIRGDIIQLTPFLSISLETFVVQAMALRVEVEG
jgi:hypothetical protein